MNYRNIPKISPVVHAYNGFTLIELLISISIIAILAGIVFGSMNFIQDKARQQKAIAEMAVIASALESYKLRNGDYPPIRSNKDSQNRVLFDALIGTRPFLDNTHNALMGLDDRVGSGKGKASLDPQQFTLGKMDEEEIKVVSQENFKKEKPNLILDPWGEPYYYRYRKVGSWQWISPSFMLWSGGAYCEEGEVTNLEAVPSNGKFKYQDFVGFEENEDDLIHGYD